MKIDDLMMSEDLLLRKAISILEKLNADEIITRQDLANKLDRTHRILSDLNPKLKDYCQMIKQGGRMMVYGNKKTIKKLRTERANLCL